MSSTTASLIVSLEATSPPAVMRLQALFPGVWRIRFGKPEEITPVSVRRSTPTADRFAGLPKVEAQAPFLAEDLRFRAHARGCTLELPFTPDEGLFGLGLQLKSHLQSGKKKHLRVNADPVFDTGDSHAPVPFYASSRGYGVYIDTARYVSVYAGTHTPVSGLEARVQNKSDAPALSTEELYRGTAIGDAVVVDIPAAQGVDVYLFAGPDLRTAIARYNLFSGGGVLPPLWALGNWYRACTNHTAAGVERLLGEFDQDRMPFTVLGLEPGWHTRFYPNSFVWEPKRFPDPAGFLTAAHQRGYKVNLWENAFIHPEAPFADAIRPYCGDQLSTDGLAPDFLTPEGRKLFADHHAKLVDEGVDGFKLDECDNGDFLPFAWSFPEHTQFPSGADGEQMHCLLGVHYQYALHDIFRARDRRHFDLVRSSGALAAPLPYVLYSDLYEHADFIRGVVVAGYSGLLWTPEVRHAASVEDLIRRVQAVVVSPLSLINGWYIPEAAWKQTDRALNEAGVHMSAADEATRLVRAALELRQRLVPYLYAAFATYAQTGVPPVRGLPMDYPQDKLAWRCDRSFMVGPDLLAAPLMAGETALDVYLPAGLWREFATGKPIKGGRTLRLENVPLDHLPLYVRDGAILPLAAPDARPVAGAVLTVTAHVYADTVATGALYHDDGLTYSGEKRGIWQQLNWTAAAGLRSSGAAPVGGTVFTLAATPVVVNSA